MAEKFAQIGSIVRVSIAAVITESTPVGTPTWRVDELLQQCKADGITDHTLWKVEKSTEDGTVLYVRQVGDLNNMTISRSTILEVVEE